MTRFRAYLTLLAHYMRPVRARVVVLAVLLTLTIGLQLLNPQIMRVFLDRATAGSERSDLVALAALFLVVALIQQGLSVVVTYVAEDVGWSATNELRGDLAAHVLDLDMAFHNEHTPGELIERLDGDVTSLSNFFSAFVIKVAANCALVIGILALLWRENLWVGLVLTLFVTAAMAAMVSVERIAIGWWKNLRGRSAEFFGFLGEQLEGVEDVKANGGVPFIFRRFVQITRLWRPARLRAFGMGGSIVWGISTATSVVGAALVFWLGARFLDQDVLTIGSVYLIFHYTEMTVHPLDEIRTQIDDLQRAGAGVERLQSLFTRESALPPSDGWRLPSGSLRVEFEGVGFSYNAREGPGPTADRVLHDVTFSVAPGRVVGVLGRSGSGKTTLARLMTRLYDPASGEVRLGGVPLQRADIADLRRRVGMVTQEVDLFRAPVRDNLTFYDDAIEDDLLYQTLSELGLRSWLDALPNGLDTPIEHGGLGLSAGQAQLLALTRILLKEPGLVILDEPSSRLDPVTEQLIDRTVKQLLDTRTAFIIAHRMVTVTHADDILILEDGRVVEFGARRDLEADRGSRFARLLEGGMEDLLA